MHFRQRTGTELMQAPLDTHKTDIEEPVETKADCRVASRHMCVSAKKAALEHRAETTAVQLVCMYDSVRGKTFSYHQVAIV